MHSISTWYGHINAATWNSAVWNWAKILKIFTSPSIYSENAKIWPAMSTGQENRWNLLLISSVISTQFFKISRFCGSLCCRISFAWTNYYFIYYSYSNQMYELSLTRWEWKQLQPRPPLHGWIPCRRLGHSFNLAKNMVISFLFSLFPFSRYPTFICANKRV